MRQSAPGRWYGVRIGPRMVPPVDPKHASFRHIVVATDFGECARLALEVAVELARPLNAEIVLVHAFHVETYDYATGLYFPVAELREAAEAALDRVVGSVRATYPNVRGLFVVDSVVAGLLDAVVQAHGDLLVTGTHGRSGLVRAVMGSVAEKVLRQARVPVLTVSSHAGEAKGG